MFSNKKYHLLAVVFYGFCFLISIKSFFDQVLLTQLSNPVLGDPAVDILTYAAIYSNLVETIFALPFYTYLIDFLLLVLPLILISKPHWRIIAFIHWMIWIVYALIYNYYGTHQTHSMVGILIMQIPFLFYGKTSFPWLWNGVRYYILWIFFSAGMWKVIRGSVFHENQGYQIFLQNQIGSIIETKSIQWHQYLIHYPNILNILFIVGVLLEIIFVVGFFTKKWDRHLALLIIFMIIGFRIIADATFFEWLIMILPFLYPISLQATTVSHAPKGNA